MGAYWSDFGGDAEAASLRRANLFIASLPIVFGGFAFMLADAVAVKSAGRVRTRQLLLFAQFANLVRVLVKDRSGTPVFETVPLCLAYCTDTRSMAILCVQNACLFSLYAQKSIAQVESQGQYHLCFKSHLPFASRAFTHDSNKLGVLC